MSSGYPVIGGCTVAAPSTKGVPSVTGPAGVSVHDTHIGVVVDGDVAPGARPHHYPAYLAEHRMRSKEFL
jgi:hypothetical protein